MVTVTTTLTGRFFTALLFLNQCSVFVDALFGRKKRLEREAAEAARAALEERAYLDKLVIFGHELNRTTFYNNAGLVALVVSGAILCSIALFSVSATIMKHGNQPDHTSPRKKAKSFTASQQEGRKEKSIPSSIKVKKVNVANTDSPAKRAKKISSTVANAIEAKFPGAMTGLSLAKRIESVLFKNGYDKDKTLLATSLCCDEVNRMFEKDFASVYGDYFSMGGLAGFAFGGVTSFGAMAHHIPDGGSCVIIYGPHVGVDSEGKVGTVNRRGRAKGGACCGSATAAAGYVKKVRAGETKESETPTKAIDAFTKRYLQLKTLGTINNTNRRVRITGGPCYASATIAAGYMRKVSAGEIKEVESSTKALDAQQSFVGNLLLPYSKRLEEAEDPDVELPQALFDAQNDFMKAIVAKACGNVEGKGKITLLGGVQINTPAGCPEYFLPKVFEIRNNEGELMANLIDCLISD